jgi:hypothetical protein
LLNETTSNGSEQTQSSGTNGITITGLSENSYYNRTSTTY